MADDRQSDQSGDAGSVSNPWGQFETYLRMATNYGLAIFLVLYYVIVIQPRDGKRINEFRQELGNVKSELRASQTAITELKSSVGRIQDDSSRRHTELTNRLEQIANRPAITTGSREGNGDITSQQLSMIRQRVETAFENHLLSSLSHNSHSREYFADEVRHVLCEEFRKWSPFDLKNAMFTADPQLVDDFDQRCNQLTDFVFDQFAEEFGLNGNGKAIPNAIELRNRARDHIRKQGDPLLLVAWRIVGK